MIKRIVDASPLLRGEAKVSTDRITFASTGATVRALNPLHLPRQPVELSILKKPAGAQRACCSYRDDRMKGEITSLVAT